MADELTNQGGFSKQDIFLTILAGMLTKDPLAYPKFKMHAQNVQLENLYRQGLMKRQEREEAMANQPVTLPIPIRPTAPEPTQAPTLPPGPIAEAFGYAPTEGGRTKPPEGATFTKQRQGGVMNVPLGRTYGSLGRGELSQLYKAWTASMQPEEEQIQHVSTPFQDESGNMFVVKTYKSGKTQTVPVTAETPGLADVTPTEKKQLKGKKPAAKTTPVSQDRGDATRKGVYDHDAKKYIWEPWEKKNAPPSRVEGFSPDKIQGLFANYNIARVKQKFDPARVEMEQSFKEEGIPIPDFMPELTLPEFTSFVKTGKLPEKKEPKLKPMTKAIFAEIDKKTKTRAEAEKMARDRGYDPTRMAEE